MGKKEKADGKEVKIAKWKKRHNMRKALIFAFVLIQTLAPMSCMSVYAEETKDTEFNVVIEDEFYYESEWDFDKWYDDEISPVKSSKRVLTGKVGEEVKVAPLDGYKLVVMDTDDVSIKKFEDVINSQGYYSASFDIYCAFVYVIDGESGNSSSKSSSSSKKTSAYERGLKYEAQAKIIYSYSTLKNPGIDGNGHPLSYSTFVKEIPNQIASAPENGTVTFGNPTYDTLPGTVMEALKQRPDVTLVFEFNYEGSARKITIPAGKADTNGYEYYGPALLISMYGE